MKIKPIETAYNGYRFRSRLEARWAVFLDSLGLKYHYELEGFDMDGTWYLPDFWLPDSEMWLEIKPDFLSADRIETAEAAMKLFKLVSLNQQTGTVAFGSPWPDDLVLWTWFPPNISLKQSYPNLNLNGIGYPKPLVYHNSYLKIQERFDVFLSLTYFFCGLKDPRFGHEKDPGFIAQRMVDFLKACLDARQARFD